MELANSRVEKKCHHFSGKTGFPSGASRKNHVSSEIHVALMWEVSETWVGNDEEQLLELEGEESEGAFGLSRTTQMTSRRTTQRF